MRHFCFFPGLRNTRLVPARDLSGTGTDAAKFADVQLHHFITPRGRQRSVPQRYSEFCPAFDPIRA